MSKGSHMSRSQQLLNLMLDPVRQVLLAFSNYKLTYGQPTDKEILDIESQSTLPESTTIDGSVSTTETSSKQTRSCSVTPISRTIGSAERGNKETKKVIKRWKKRSSIPRPNSAKKPARYYLKSFITTNHCNVPLTPVAILQPIKKQPLRTSSVTRSRVRDPNTSMNNKDSNQSFVLDNVTSDPSLESSVSSNSENQACSKHANEVLYFIGGNNVEGILSGYGWKRTRNKSDESWKFKWCELRSSINFQTFKEGEQMVNHIPNCDVLTNKQGLLVSLQDYNRMNFLSRHNKIDFFPETYRLDEAKDRDKVAVLIKEGDVWICKPTGRNQGKGIFLIRRWDDYYKPLYNDLNLAITRGKPLERIVQRYISNPLLINTRKFDIRAYMLIASTIPYLVLYHKGYIRLSMNKYDINCNSITTHLTNQYIQKKDPKYGMIKEDTVWTMDKFNDYINDTFASSKNLEPNWVYNTLTEKMHSIMRICFESVKGKLTRRLGYFELYGFDFMVDDNLKVWLLEINVNPSLATNCEGLRHVIPGVVKEAIDIAIECFEKSRRKQPLMPLMSLKNFEILHPPITSNINQRSVYKTSKAVEQQTNESLKKYSETIENSKEINLNLSAKKSSSFSSNSTKKNIKAEVSYLTSAHLKALTGQMMRKSLNGESGSSTTSSINSEIKTSLVFNKVRCCRRPAQNQRDCFDANREINKIFSKVCDASPVNKLTKKGSNIKASQTEETPMRLKAMKGRGHQSFSKEAKIPENPSKGKKKLRDELDEVSQYNPENEPDTVP